MFAGEPGAYQGPQIAGEISEAVFVAVLVGLVVLLVASLCWGRSPIRRAAVVGVSVLVTVLVPGMLAWPAWPAWVGTAGSGQASCGSRWNPDASDPQVSQLSSLCASLREETALGIAVVAGVLAVVSFALVMIRGRWSHPADLVPTAA